MDDSFDKLRAGRLKDLSYGALRQFFDLFPDLLVDAAALALYRSLGFELERSEADYFGEAKPRVLLRASG